MNIHPLLVHFPIALLTVYAIFELLRFKRLHATVYWFYVKACLVIVGGASALPTVISGLIIAPQFQAVPAVARLVQIHATFAFFSSLIFGILAVSYGISWYRRARGGVSVALLRGFISVPLAVIGLILITVTGALGASIVYGPDIDPFVRFIYTAVVGR